MTLAFHDYANLFPLIEGQEFYDLAEDIRVNGLQDRVVLIGDGADGHLILDGRNRYRALCWIVSTQEPLGAGWRGGRTGFSEGDILTIEDLLDVSSHLFNVFHPQFDGDPLAFVLSKNLNRRHLDESQRAMVAARLGRLGRGGDRTKGSIEPLSADRRADMLNVARESVKRAQAVQDHAVPEISEAVDRGHLAVSAAAELATQPAERQAEIVKALPRDAEGRLLPEVKKALGPVIKEIRAEKVAAKKEKRAEREQQRGRKLQALTEKNFGVAIEDFEWDHEPWSRETGVERHPSMHYETAEDAHTPEEIVARCAERFACLADDCILFKWATVPHLAIAIRVMELQGFRYVTSLVWNKERPGKARGPGYWFTGEHEIVLVGVRGKVDAPATAHFRSSFSAPVGEHSEKPSNIHEIIEFHWPTTPKVEFNARRARPGWTAWGFDAPAVSPQGEIGTATDASDSSSSARAEDWTWNLANVPAVAKIHTVRMTRDYPDGASFSVATCRCGWSFRVETSFEGCQQRDKAVKAHWHEIEHSQANAGDEPALESEPAGMEAPVSRVADGRTSDEDAPGSHGGASSPIADGGEPSLAVDRPAPSAVVAPAESGAVVSDAADVAAGCPDDAVPPANRPGRLIPIGEDPLDIPPFLRRGRLQQAEMDLARRDHAPAEIVDDALQTRLPLTEDEIELQATLAAIDEGREVEWSIMRSAIGAGFASATSTKVYVTDQGRAFQAQLVGRLPPVAHGEGARA